jgi:hypothetical protein
MCVATWASASGRGISGITPSPSSRISSKGSAARSFPVRTSPRVRGERGTRALYQRSAGFTTLHELDYSEAARTGVARVSGWTDRVGSQSKER